MKILLVSDLHYALKQFDWMHEIAGDYDAVMISGDVLDIVSAVPLQGQLVVILNHLKQLSRETRLFICSGKHDLTGRSEAGEKVAQWMADVRRAGIVCDGDCIELGEWRVSVCPWWDGPVARDGVRAQLAEDSQKSGQRWLWLYHAPPDDSPTSWSGKKHFGDEPLLYIYIYIYTSADLSIKWTDVYLIRLVRGSSSTIRCWSYAVISINPLFERGAPGQIGLGRPGSSTPGTRLVRSPAISCSIPRLGGQPGIRSQEPSRSTSRI